MDFNALFKQLWIWMLSLFLGAACVFSFWFWAESKLGAPGNLRDVLYWEGVTHGAAWAGDLEPFSGYLHQRTAEILISDSVRQDVVMTFTLMDRIIRDSAVSRRIPDLNYSLKIYKKQLLLEMPAVLRFYYAFLQKLGVGKSSKEFTRFASASALSKEELEGLRRKVRENDIAGAVAAYEKLIQKPELKDLEAHCLLALAYLSYEEKPSAAKKYLNEMSRKTHDVYLLKAARYLQKKISKKRPALPSSEAISWKATRIPQALKLGLFNQVKAGIKENAGAGYSGKLNECAAWLDVSGFGKGESQGLAQYFDTLSQLQSNPKETAARLTAASEAQEMSPQAALLRYQAWQTAYFNAQDFEQAFKILAALKAKDPLSPYSQIEQMEGLFKKSLKTYSGSDLEKIWEVEPYRFDKERTNDWQAFQSGSKNSQVLVHEGLVYFVKYDETGKAERLQMVGEGQKGATKDDVEVPDVSQMSMVERYFYDLMSKVIPSAVYSFKNELAARARAGTERTFMRFYTEQEFQTYILDRVRKSLGSAAQEVQVSINEQGFNIYALFDVKIAKIPVSGIGRVLVDQQDGRLILNMDHVKFGPVEAPKWMLKQIEKNFERTANSDEDVRASLDILDMQYQKGGIQMKCRQTLLRKN